MPAAPVANAVGAVAATTAAASAPAAAGAAAAAAATKAPLLTGTGWFGLSAGAAGLAITLLNTWKDTVGNQRGLDASSAFGPTGMALGGGAALLLLGEKGGMGTTMLRNGLRGAGVALVLGGLAGAVAGAIQRFGTPLRARELDDNRLQTPIHTANELPPAPANLEGVAVAWGEAITNDRALKDVAVYVDPTTAKQLPKATPLGEAIGRARAATQADEDDRSHAVVQTLDGSYWVMRLSGDLDQVDGRNYTTGNDFDPRREPLIGKRQAALQAIAGVESIYVFPEGSGAKEAPQDPGDIPWVTPELPGAPTPTPTSSPTTAESES